MVGIVFPRTANGCFSASGDDIGNDKLIVFHEGSGVDIVGPSQVGSDAIAIPQARFNEMVEVLSPTAERFEKTSIVEGNVEKLHELRDSIVDLISRPELDPNGEQVSNVIGLSIAWMYDSSSQWSREEPKAFGARTRVARLAQEYIEAQFCGRVCIEDICRITGVGVRTLQRHFQRYFDSTISEYLNAVRLDSARRELAAACPLQDSVGMIARRNGCVHPGRFSVGYLQHFGESPSDTLARQAGS
jgi:AraC-like DNA-binding protein